MKCRKLLYCPLFVRCTDVQRSASIPARFGSARNRQHPDQSMSHGVALGPQLSPPSAILVAEGVRRFELTPRCSLTARTARLFVGSLALTTFSVAVFFTVQGFWPILPFAGLEIAVLIWAVRASMRKGRERETITALSGLTERNLADIGIVPANVEEIAREAARA